MNMIDLNLSEIKYSDVSTDELAHYGIKGMKWGVRKDKDVSKMTDAELRAVLTRMDLEQRYAKMSNPQNKIFSKGKEMVSNAMASAGKQVLTQIGIYALTAVIAKTAGPEVAKAIKK